MDAPIGTYISFATAPGRIASDGFEGSDDANGLFTRHLLGALRMPGLKVEDVFKQVRVKVMQESDGVQVPWDNSSLTGDFYFNPVLATSRRRRRLDLPESASSRQGSRAGQCCTRARRHHAGPLAERSMHHSLTR
jgi:uncharacterized caspase-like protein